MFPAKTSSRRSPSAAAKKGRHGQFSRKGDVNAARLLAEHDGAGGRTACRAGRADVGKHQGLALPTSAPAATNATATNATATNATAAGANQTAPATNLTSSDIEPIRDSLNSAREGLQDNDTQAAIESINDADGTLFAIIIEEGTGPISDQLTTLSDDLDTTRESVRNLDNAKALEDLNAADSQLLVITEMLPTEEADEEEEPEEEPEEE